MSVLKNEELEILVKVEHLIMSSKRVEMFKELDETGKCYFNDEEITNEDINTYWNIVDRLLKTKDVCREKAKQFNKDNAEYHRLNVNYYAAKKKNNKERMEYYAKKLEEYKERKKEERL